MSRSPNATPVASWTFPRGDLARVLGPATVVIMPVREAPTLPEVSEAFELRYPTGSVLMVAGIPGAGKSTLIQRLFGAPANRTAATAVVLDSAEIRAVLARWLGPRVPYAAYRPVVHTLHYWRIAAWTLGPRRNLVVHECGTRDWARRTIARLAATRRRQAHLLFLDTPPNLALAGQRSRGRVVPTQSFVRHSSSWTRLRSAVDEVVDPAIGPAQDRLGRQRPVRRLTRAPSLRREGWTSARSITREQATALRAIRFD
jgi:hypothetical protein